MDATCRIAMSRNWLIDQSHDIAAGFELILQLAEQSWLDRDYKDSMPDLHEGQALRVMRFAISVSELLSERAMEILSKAEDSARKKAKS